MLCVGMIDARVGVRGGFDVGRGLIAAVVRADGRGACCFVGGGHIRNHAGGLPVLKWGFRAADRIIPAVVGAFLYVPRLPRGRCPGLHERYRRPRAGGRRWDRRCTASPATGVGIIAGCRACRACFGLAGLARGGSSSTFLGFALRLDDFSKDAVSCATWREAHICARAEQHVHLGAALHETC